MVKCRICKSDAPKKFLSLGQTPLANSFLKKEQLGSKEPYFPLEVYYCDNCGLVQLGYVVPSEVMFKDYIYFTGTSTTMAKHFADLANQIAKDYLNKGSLVVEFASNDGTLLKNFKPLGIRAVGVEPATNVAKVAQEAGVETVNDFFNEKAAARVAEKYGAADAIIGTNVFAHIDDLDEVLKGVGRLLSPEGVLVLEFPYLVNLLENAEFDTIYHEHLSYFALRPLVYLFKRFGMRVFDARRTPVHGGSIAVYVARQESSRKENKSVAELLELEKKLGLESFETYEKFAADVEALKKKLLTLLKKLKSEGKTIAGYGAPAKGNTLLNYFGIGTETLDYIVDKSQYKQGYYTPGKHIPVYAPEKLMQDKPDYLLILAWNMADEIMKQQDTYHKAGGKFIIPVPEPKIV